MTISTTTSSISYSGNGVTTGFAVPFPFFASDELEVIERVTSTGAETTKVLTTDYTVVGGDGSTGTVTMLTAPASGRTLTIRRNTDRTQETDYPENDPFPAASHERALDRLTAIVQEVERDQTGRALLVPKTDGAVGTLPNSVDRASKYLAFDASGNPMAAAAPAGTSVVTAFGASLIDDATAAAARATLGSGAMGDAVFLAATAAAARDLLFLPDTGSLDYNLLVNGGGEVWRASTTLSIAASTTATGSIYAADQWCMETSANQACTISQQAGLSTNSRYCMRVQRNSGQTGTAVLRYQQPLELWDCIRLRGQQLVVTAQMRAGANLSGTLRLKLLTGTGSEGRRTNAAAYTGEATPLDVALSLTTSTAQVTGTSSAVASNITQATLCVEWTPSGTAGAADYFELDDVVLAIGTVVRPYPVRGYQQELSRCLRFLRQVQVQWQGDASGANAQRQGFQFDPMRATPTAALNTSGTASNIGTLVCVIVSNGTGYFGGAAGGAGNFNWIGSIYDLDARL